MLLYGSRKGVGLKYFSVPFKRTQLGLIIGSALLAATSLNPKPVRGAERVFASFLSFEQSISLDSLEIFAQEGKITGDLIPYARYFAPERRPLLQKSLTQKLEISPVAISQFLYSDMGELMVSRLAQVVKPKSNHGGFFALRGALITAAADSQGLTALNFLKKYPTQGIKIDLAEGLAIFSQVRRLIRDTDSLVQSIEAQSPATTLISPTGEALTKPGSYGWEKIEMTLSDQSQVRQNYTGRSRQYPIDLYLPKSNLPQPKPIIIISHGLNSNQYSYAYLAEHLASHGFVVAVPEHIGSNTNQLKALLVGREQEVTEPTEFLDRPLDVHFLLDELERLSSSDPTFQGQLNLEQVGVIGQSFRGYTALALAGAKLNFGQLQQDCGSRLKDTINISLILQCQALRLPQQNYDLKDSRIKAIIAINPIDSSVFGKTLGQIQLPVMFMSGSADKVSPALFEQVPPFTQLTTADKYFVLMQGGTHFSTIAEDLPGDSDAIPVPQGIYGPSPGLAKTYLSALSVAYMKRYLLEDLTYQSYLSSQYVATLSQDPLKLNLTQKISSK